MSKPYRTDLKPVWCAGCGDFAVLQAITGAFQELELPAHRIGIFSGIGCSSRISGYIGAYGFNLLHGRSLPTAIGAKLYKPELTVLSIGGDGDLFSIGGGHMAHAVRSNIDVTCICLNNHVYGLTKGQTSPTTPQSLAAAMTGAPSPIDPVLDVLAYSSGTLGSFVAQGISSDPKQLKDLIVGAIRHPGFSFVNILTRCPTYRAEAFDQLKGRCVQLANTHDERDLDAALLLARTPVEGSPHLGIFYRGDGNH